VRHRVIACEELFRGTIEGASVHPREIVKAALRHNAAALLIAHLHPSGDPKPSQADEQITQRIKSAAALVDIRLIDHCLGGFCSVTTAFKMYQRLGFHRINREHRIQLPDGDTIRLGEFSVNFSPAGTAATGLSAIFAGG
jgi:hypothetical protein